MCIVFRSQDFCVHCEGHLLSGIIRACSLLTPYRHSRTRVPDGTVLNSVWLVLSVCLLSLLAFHFPRFSLAQGMHDLLLRCSPYPFAHSLSHSRPSRHSQAVPPPMSSSPSTWRVSTCYTECSLTSPSTTIRPILLSVAYRWVVS